MSRYSPVFLHALGLVNALGQGKEAVCRGLMAGESSGMVLESGWLPQGEARVGRVSVSLPKIPPSLAKFQSRNNQLLLAAFSEIEAQVQAVMSRVGKSRVGIVLGTSTSGIAEAECAVAERERVGAWPERFHYAQQELGSPARFLADYLGISGPTYVVSTACTSSAKAMAAARNLLLTGICDAVIAGGVDSLCRLTVCGFTALESATAELCNPLSRNRKGINVGEAAAVFLMSRDPAPIALLGVGESSDAYHISAPDPEGIGAELAMRAALKDASVSADQIGYVNLHGTATSKNDSMETHAVKRVLEHPVPCSSTKPLTGHTLGAAGATEAAFCYLALSEYNSERVLPPHVWDGELDPNLAVLRLVDQHMPMPQEFPRVLMSNSFAFGGNNISLLIGEID